MGRRQTCFKKEKPHISRWLLEFVFRLFISLVFKLSPSDHQIHSSLNWPMNFFFLCLEFILEIKIYCICRPFCLFMKKVEAIETHLSNVSFSTRWASGGWQLYLSLPACWSAGKWNCLLCQTHGEWAQQWGWVFTAALWSWIMKGLDKIWEKGASVVFLPSFVKTWGWGKA